MGQIRFNLGRVRVGKTYRNLMEIKEKCANLTSEDPIFILTPEQMTFYTEYQLLLMNEASSMIRVNALSFRRLAHRILQEAGGLARYPLDETGKAMLLQKIMNEKREELGLFGRQAKKMGFIQKLDELFAEFKSYQLDTGNLRQLISNSSLNQQNIEKISTLVDLFDTFNEQTLSNYLTTEDYFTLLYETIKESETIRKSDVYIDGYHSFNVQERLIINQLAKHAKSLTITLTCDLESNSPLWKTTTSTYQSLVQDFVASGFDFDEKRDVRRIKREDQDRLLPEGLLHLEKNFPTSGQTSTNAEGIAFFSTNSKELQIEEVAKRIYQLAHEEQIPYHNIAVYSANPTTDHLLYDAIFKKHDIPYFLDVKEPLSVHPVMTLLHQVFDVFSSKWNHIVLISLLRTGLFVDLSNIKKGTPYEDLLNDHLEEVDQLENFLLAHQTRENHWKSAEPWTHERYEGTIMTDEATRKDAKLNVIRDQVVIPLLALEEAFGQATTTCDFARAIFTFLEALEIPQKLHLLELNATSRGQAREKKQHEQVWNKLLSLLEQVVEVGKEEKINTDEFANLLRIGILNLSYATVPPVLDGVQIGDIKRSRFSLATNFNEPMAYGIQHTFIIGINDGELPTPPVENSLLTEAERKQLVELGIPLAPSLIQSGQDEVFNFYTLLTPSKSLTLSYVATEEHHPSYLFTQIKNLFPTTEVEKVTKTEVYDQLTTAQALYGSVLQQSSYQNDAPYYQPIFDYYQQVYPLKHDLMKQSLGYANQVDALELAETKELYGEEIEASVSRIEQFNKCEFAHFMSYGLKLREREAFQITVPDIGNLYHEALKYVSELIKREGRSFSGLSTNDCRKLAEIGVKEVTKGYVFKALHANRRMKVLKRKLTLVVDQTLLTLAKQGKRSGFKESAFEVPFGRRKKDQIQTEQHQVGAFKYSLRGIIDRIDVAQVDDKRYLRVLDYKSSKKELELDALYHGLSLQLLTYLDVAIKGADQISDIGGALYFHVQRPYAMLNEEVLGTSDLEMRLSAEHAKGQKMTGYLPDDREVAYASDIGFEKGEVRSNVVPITFKKDGTLAATGNRVLSLADFDLLRAYTNHKIESSLKNMVTGKLDIAPMAHKGETSCDHCKYKSICKFEAPYNKYHRMPQMKADESLTKMTEKLET